MKALQKQHYCLLSCSSALSLSGTAVQSGSPTRSIHSPCCHERPLTRSDASLTLVPNPKAGSEGLVLLTWDPNPLRSIFVLESGCLMALRPLSILTSPTNYKMIGNYRYSRTAENWHYDYRMVSVLLPKCSFAVEQPNYIHNPSESAWYLVTCISNTALPCHAELLSWY